MSYTVETVNAQFINQAFIDKLETGHAKEAMAVSSTFVRQKLREEGFARKIFTPQSITAADLDRDVTEVPRIIVEKEPDSIAASFALTGAPEIRYYKAPRYEVFFHKIASADFRKTKAELATYKANIQQILQENSVKDLQRQEDGRLIERLDAIAADSASGNYGQIDNSLTGFGIRTLMEQIKALTKTEQKPGKILMAYNTYLSLLSRQARIVGGDVAGEHFRGAGMTSFYGFEIITTNKHDIMSSTGLATANNLATFGDKVYVFAPENYLGQFYSMQEPTVFIKTEADMIEFQTYEYVGMGLGNTKGFVSAKYNVNIDADVVTTHNI